MTVTNGKCLLGEHMLRIDAHLHFISNHPDCVKTLDDLDTRLLNICGVWTQGLDWRTEQAAPYRALHQGNPKRFSWCTTFDLPRFNDPNYVESCIETLRQDFRDGACAVKIWKNIGMEIKDPSGRWFMVDDPLFTPILNFIEQSGKTLLMHIAEPLACWQPLMDHNPHSNYYKGSPEWHMYGKPGVASHAELIQARDNLVARHPKLRCVGAHLGSLEYDVSEIAKRFDQYPNFAVDTSARLLDFMLQDTKKVRQFFLDYQDRIMFGTDCVSTNDKSNATQQEIRDANAGLCESFHYWKNYLERNDNVKVWRWEAIGLGLPESVLEKVYYKNAERWYPGI